MLFPQDISKDQQLFTIGFKCLQLMEDINTEALLFSLMVEFLEHGVKQEASFSYHLVGAVSYNAYKEKRNTLS